MREKWLRSAYYMHYTVKNCLESISHAKIAAHEKRLSISKIIHKSVLVTITFTFSYSLPVENLK